MHTYGQLSLNVSSEFEELFVLESQSKIKPKDKEISKSITLKIISILNLLLEFLFKINGFKVADINFNYFHFSCEENIYFIPDECKNLLQAMFAYEKIITSNNEVINNRKFKVFKNAFSCLVLWFRIKANNSALNSQNCKDIITVIDAYIVTTKTHDLKVFSKEHYDDIGDHKDEEIKEIRIPRKGRFDCLRVATLSMKTHHILDDGLEGHWNEFDEMFNTTKPLDLDIDESKTEEQCYSDSSILDKFYDEDNHIKVSEKELLKLIVSMSRDIKLLQKEVKVGFGQVADQLSEIRTCLENLTSRIVEYQNDVSDKLTRYPDDEMAKEEAFEEFCDRMTKQITKSLQVDIKGLDYKREESYLKMVFGDSWGKLNDKSKSFLVTAKVLFAQMVTTESELDYSGVCILVTKALEEELKIRFYDRFIVYLKNKYPFPEKANAWHSSSVEEKKGSREKILLPAYRFTLGSVYFFCLPKKPRWMPDNIYTIDSSRIREYGEESLFNKMNAQEIIHMLNFIGDKANYVKDRYRNRAAHTNELKRIDAKSCFDEIVDVQKIFVQIMSSFRY